MESQGVSLTETSQAPEGHPSPIHNPRVVPIVVRGGSVKLSIPIDERRASAGPEDEPVPTYRRHRRDSLERREALLKGREGTRRRQRWENGMICPGQPSF
jgi:R3H-associated N-terminal domain